MMVGDDHVEPERAGARDLGHRRDPAVDGEDEVDAVRRQLLDRLGGEPVALLEAARETPLDVRAQLAQRQKSDNGRGDAVDVVVAVDANPLPVAHRDADPLHCRGHVAEPKGVVARRLRSRETRARRRGRRARDGRALSRSCRSARALARGRRPAPSRTVSSSSGRPAWPSRRYGRGRTVLVRAPWPESAGRALTRTPEPIYRRWVTCGVGVGGERSKGA